MGAGGQYRYDFSGGEILAIKYTFWQKVPASHEKVTASHERLC